MTSFTCIHTNGVYQQYKGNICNRAFKCGSELPEYVALILRNGGSQSPDRWLRELRNNQLEEFRFLLNYRFDSMSPMAVVLVGQTELWENKLKLQRYAAVRQRIDMYCTLPHLDRSETEQYIASHMDYSGCTQEVFTAKALDEIHKASAGIPRMVNRICEKALMYAFQNQKRLIDDYMIKFVIEHEMLGTITT